jgi:hypothetical protein
VKLNKQDITTHAAGEPRLKVANAVSTKSRAAGKAAVAPAEDRKIRTTLILSCGWPTEASVPAKRTTRRAA